MDSQKAKTCLSGVKKAGLKNLADITPSGHMKIFPDIAGVSAINNNTISDIAG
jgi:hypothetical protein